MTSLKIYPSYRKTDLPWLGQIPAHWEVKRLKQVTDVAFSSVDKLSHEDEKPVLLSNYVDVYKNEQISSDLEFMKATASDDEIERFTLRKNDVMITKDSESSNDIAIPAYVPNDLENVLCGYHLALIRPNPEEMDGKFLLRLLQSKTIRYQFEVEATGITRYGIDQYAIGSALFPIPPISEQQAIAAYLDHQTAKIDTLIAKKERLLDLLAEQRSALIDHATTKGLNRNVKMKDSGLQWLGKIPEHWEIIRSKRLFDVRNVKASISDKQLTVSQEFGVITQEEYMAKGSRVVQVIKGADILKHVEPNDFIISMRSFQGGIEWSKIGGSTSSAYVVLVPNEQVHCPYFSYLLKSKQYIQALQSTSNLIRDGQALRYSNFCIVDLPLVPLSEQKAIAEYLDKKIAGIDALVEKVYQAIEHLHEYRAALISSAVTGKIDVKGD